MAETLVWLREDLRIADNPALHAAAELGQAVTVLFVFDELSPGVRPLGGASRWWLHHSLEALSTELAQLGVRLVIRSGAAREVLTELLAAHPMTHVFWNRRYGLAEREIDTALKAELRERGITVQSFHANLFNEPWQVETDAGRPYTVFTPYYRKCLTFALPRAPLPTPQHLVASSTPPPSASLTDLALLPTAPDWAQGLRERWQPGSSGARARLHTFVTERMRNYKVGRDFVAQLNTSELSAHLRWGEISVFEIAAVVRAQVAADPELAAGAEAFLREVYWREFSYHLLYHWPHLATQNFNSKFDAFVWREPEDPETKRLLSAWQRGATGIPLVDAGIRELWHTGVMHNRVRMVAASFLTKNLRIHWREGERWFWDTLVDADPANNAASWQWVAGSGADAAPYFRIFNPELQAAKFDPDRSYVTKWVPEVDHEDYRAIIDLRHSRDAALAAYEAVKESPA